MSKLDEKMAFAARGRAAQDWRKVAIRIEEADNGYNFSGVTISRTPTDELLVSAAPETSARMNNALAAYKKEWIAARTQHLLDDWGDRVVFAVSQVIDEGDGGVED